MTELSYKRSWMQCLNVFKTRDKDTMVLLFNSLVRSRLEFCSELWDPSGIAQINAIEAVQRVFTRKIYGLKTVNYWKRLNILNIFSLQRRRERKTIIYVWKIKNGLVRNDIKLCFENNDRRSQSRAIVEPVPKIRGKILSAFEQSFVIRAAKLWNRLPPILCSLTIYSSFVKELDKWLKAFPDEPPINGYYHRSTNSLIDSNLHNLRQNYL